MGYKKILVTVDGSKLSEQALEHVVRIADAAAQIHVLSVIANDRVSEVVSLVSARSSQPSAADKPQWPATGARIDPYDAHAREKYVQEIGEWLAQAGFETTCEVRSGDIPTAILEVARQHFEIIVMVTHGRSGAAKMVMGSVTEAVMQQVPCPVLLIRAQSG